MTAPQSAAATEALLKILERQRRNDYAHPALAAALDGFLKRELSGELGSSPQRRWLKQLVARLPAAGYASLTPDQRRAWHTMVERALNGAAPPDTQADAKATASPPAQGRPRSPRAEPGKPEAETPKRSSPNRSRHPRPPEGEIADDLETPATALGRVSAPARRGLETLGVQTAYDLIWHLPIRHEDFRNVQRIADLLFDKAATVVARVESSRLVRMRKGRVATEAVLSDGTGSIRGWWWNQPYLHKQLTAGLRVAVSGTVRQRGRYLQFDSPLWERLNESDDDSLEDNPHVGRLVPVYPLTRGLPNRTVRRLTWRAVRDYLPLLAESLPPRILEETGFPGEREALRVMHFPKREEEIEVARERLAFQELLAIQLAVLSRKREARRRNDAPRIAMDGPFLDNFLGALPFQLTRAQSNALTDIRNDIARSEPMARLLQGDVGSGKTVVAAAAMLAAVKAGYQTVLMAPTEVLASQHYRTFERLFVGRGESALYDFEVTPALGRRVRMALLVGSMSDARKREVREQIEAGELDLVVGTHALIEESTALRKLGLAVVDEQHRFGVLQRDALRSKGSPHLLVMTATPIPRTLALTIYGELDNSTIDELPPGRQRVATRVIEPHQRDEVYERIREEAAAGNQAFIICPLIEESDKLEAASATQEFERLCSGPLADLAPRMRLLHGRMPADEKQAVMADLAAGDASVVVATIVVEVGVDLPKATVMAIEAADRFGLAQLHQLRGRVGRSDLPSSCFLISDTELPEAQKRLRIMERTADGFELAEVDLETRGPGEYFGTRQAGLPDLRVAKLTDHRLINLARNWANRILDEDPHLRAPEHQLLRHRAGGINVSGAAAVH